jgi:putative ABC transport system ATP-binding protein
MIIIEMKNITKTFFNADIALTVLKGISFSVERGEFLSITGPSGSGKSTLMHIIGCLDTPTSGSYLIDNKDVSQLDGNALAAIRNNHIGFVFQKFHLLPDLNALNNVALPQLYANKSEKEALAKAQEKLELVGLADRMNHYPNQLSGGQQQRVAIARALVNDPDIILADEPTGNLDSATGSTILEILTHLNKDHGATIIIVTHDLELAKKTNRIIKLFDGSIVG